MPSSGGSVVQDFLLGLTSALEDPLLALAYVVLLGIAVTCMLSVLSILLGAVLACLGSILGVGVRRPEETETRRPA